MCNKRLKKSAVSGMENTAKLKILYFRVYRQIIQYGTCNPYLTQTYTHFLVVCYLVMWFLMWPVYIAPLQHLISASEVVFLDIGRYSHSKQCSCMIAVPDYQYFLKCSVIRFSAHLFFALISFLSSPI